MVFERLAVVALLIEMMGCAMSTTPYGEDRHEEREELEERGNSATTTSEQKTPSRPLRADAGSTVLANAPPAACEPQPVNWTVDPATCTANLDTPLASGATQTLADTTGDATGKVTVGCTDGRLTTSAVTCELPQEFDVNSQTGCINGYCKAAISGRCGVPDEANANAICIYKGYARQSAFTTRPGPNGVRQCNADGSSCFVNANPSCNIVFATVTCVR